MPWQTDPTTGKKIYVTEDGNQSFSLDGELLLLEEKLLPYLRSKKDLRVGQIRKVVSLA